MHYNIVDLMENFTLIGNKQQSERPPYKLPKSNDDTFGRDVQVGQYSAWEKNQRINPP